ncbi:MAG TPA: FHA domain-containing protein [Anaeromyxobacter sp.]|nr:FHA domain-containing protein [Anaeromyxobacter sp.]
MRLVIEDQAGTRSIVPFASDEITVGRAAEGVTFRLTDRDVSRRHARFLRVNGGIWVEDLGSLTGTRVNGERITARRRLREGDLVEIGDYDLAVLPEEGASLPGLPPPLPPAPRPAAPAPASPRTVTPTPAAAVPAPPTAARPATAPAAAAPAAPRGDRARVLRQALVAGAIALALGLLAGWLAGALGGKS